MYGETKRDIQCTEFELLMAEALDGLLPADRRIAFDAHAAACSVCGPLLAEAQTGLHWLKSLDEVEPPPHLANRIMAATAGSLSPSAVPAPAPGWTRTVRDWFAPVFATVRQPRFAMSFGMAFFSISLLLNAAGVRLSGLRYADLRPSTVVRGFYETKGKIVSYYENIRWVYELETRVRELKKATTPPENAPQGQPKDRKDNTRGEPDRNRYRNYSRDEAQPLLALYREPAPLAATWRES